MLNYLPYLTQSSKYKIAVLANSSVASAEAAIKEHHLPAEVKAYGSPADIAADPNVDMVVVSVNVAQHYDLIKPALEAGKMAYVEWPLGNNTAEAEELTELAKKKNLKTMVACKVDRAASPGQSRRLLIVASWARYSAQLLSQK
jgi:predicted dehydrogenase